MFKTKGQKPKNKMSLQALAFAKLSGAELSEREYELKLMLPDMLRELLPLVKEWPALPHESEPKPMEYFHFTCEYSKTIPVQLSIQDCQDIVSKYVGPAISYGGEPMFHHDVIAELMQLRDSQNVWNSDRHTVFAVTRMSAFQTLAGRQMLQSMFKKMEQPPEWSSEYFIYKDMEALADLAATSFKLVRDKVMADHADVIAKHLKTLMANKEEHPCFANYLSGTRDEQWRSLY